MAMFCSREAVDCGSMARGIRRALELQCFLLLEADPGGCGVCSPPRQLCQLGALQGGQSRCKPEEPSV